ncbi:unnamed protein product [Cochlearia groenlandica]
MSEEATWIKALKIEDGEEVEDHVNLEHPQMVDSRIRLSARTCQTSPLELSTKWICQVDGSLSPDNNTSGLGWIVLQNGKNHQNGIKRIKKIFITASRRIWSPIMGYGMHDRLRFQRDTFSEGLFGLNFIIQ